MVKTLKPASRADDKVLPDTTQRGNRFVAANTIIYFAGRLREAERERKAAAKKYASIRKQFKNTGITLGVFDLVSNLAEQDNPDAFEHFFEEASHVAEAFAMVPEGTQFSLFEGPKNPMDELAKAKKRGFNLALQGDNCDTQAYPENTDLGQAHLEGWNEGQAVRQQEFIQHNERVREEEAALEAKKAEQAKRREARAAKKADAEGRTVPVTADGDTVQ